MARRGRLRAHSNQKARIARHATETRTNKYTGPSSRLKMIPLGALGGSILLYVTHTPPNPTYPNFEIAALIPKLNQIPDRPGDNELRRSPQRRYCGRGKCKLYTIERKLRRIRFQMYARWKHTVPTAYLNNAPVINDRLNLVNNLKEPQSNIQGYINEGGSVESLNPTRPL